MPILIAKRIQSKIGCGIESEYFENTTHRYEELSKEAWPDKEERKASFKNTESISQDGMQIILIKIFRN